MLICSEERDHSMCVWKPTNIVLDNILGTYGYRVRFNYESGWLAKRSNALHKGNFHWTNPDSILSDW